MSITVNDTVYTESDKIILITNKSLHEQTRGEIRKYIINLNQNALTLDWQAAAEPI